MQFLKLDYELITDTKITSNEFRIYTYLLSRYNIEYQGAFPSYETIATKLNIGIATVKRSVKNLVKLGYMIIEKAKGKKGNYNIYKKLKYLINSIKEHTRRYKNELKNKSEKVKKVVKNVFNKSQKFNNYKQREYDYDKLENELLGWD